MLFASWDIDDHRLSRCQGIVIETDSLESGLLHHHSVRTRLKIGNRISALRIRLGAPARVRSLVGCCDLCPCDDGSGGIGYGYLKLIWILEQRDISQISERTAAY